MSPPVLQGGGEIEVWFDTSGRDDCPICCRRGVDKRSYLNRARDLFEYYRSQSDNETWLMLICFVFAFIDPFACACDFGRGLWVNKWHSILANIIVCVAVRYVYKYYAGLEIDLLFLVVQYTISSMLSHCLMDFLERRFGRRM